MSLELKTAASFGPTPLMNCTGVSNGFWLKFETAGLFGTAIGSTVFDRNDNVVQLALWCDHFNFIAFFFADE